MIKKVLKDNKGEAYIGFIVGIFLSLIVVVFALKLYPVFIAKAQLNQFANEIMREAEITAEIGTKMKNKIDELNKSLIEVDSISWDTKYINGTKKINLNEKINVTVEKQVDIGFFIFGSYPIDLSARETGASEVYFK